MGKLLPIINNKVWIPAKWVGYDSSEIKKTYEHHIYDDAQCNRCQFRAERHCGECEECPAFLRRIKLWSESEIEGKPYFGLPSGDIPRVENVIGKEIVRWVDERSERKMRKKIRFTSKLHTGKKVDGNKTVNQRKAVNDWMVEKNGIIEAPARSGKTIMSTYISCNLGLTTLIVANQEELLEQFYKTYMEHTNIKKYMTKKRPIIKIIKKMSDFKGVDIALINYQKFIFESTAPERIIRYLKDRFGLLIVDEVHDSGAPKYSQFLNKLNPLHKLGLSATPDRKDGMSDIIYDIMGPVRVKITSTLLIPEIEEWKTDYYYPNKSFAHLLNNMAKTTKRNNDIVNHVLKEVKKGHSVIVICERRNQIAELTNMFNKEALRLQHKGEMNQNKIARPFYGNVDRKKILQDYEKGYFKVLVAIKRLMRQGVDMKIPTRMLVTVPVSATDKKNREGEIIGSPLFYQMSKRVCTAAKFKKGEFHPKVTIMIDKSMFGLACYKKLRAYEIEPKLGKKYLMKNLGANPGEATKWTKRTSGSLFDGQQIKRF